MRNRRLKLVLLAATLWAFMDGHALARDYLLGMGLLTWSPDSKWLVVPDPVGNELLLVQVQTGRSYRLKPVGDLELGSESVFTDKPSAEKPQFEQPRESRVIPVFGTGKLRAIEWWPDSAHLVYQSEGKRRAVYSLLEEKTVQRLGPTDPLPWRRADDLQLAYEYRPAVTNQAARYWIRVQKPDGAVVKQVVFEDPREVLQVGVFRYREPSVLSNDKTFLLYPRLAPKGWQLMRDALAADAKALPITEPSANAPYAWALTGDDRWLAVADENALTVGQIEQWNQAHKIPLDKLDVALAWSPDGRFLAYNDKDQLFLLQRGSDAPTRVSNFCAPRFWGWRGLRLYFGDARTSPANLYYIEPAKPTNAVQVVKSKLWETAPRDLSISSDGRILACQVADLDWAGRPISQLWIYPLLRSAEVESAKTNLDVGFVISQPIAPSTVETNVEWRLLYTFAPEPLK
jgi:hypothetical protein